MSEPAPQTENIEVHSTHFGYGHEYETLRVIADRLAQPEGRWMPYAGSSSASSASSAAPRSPAPPNHQAHGRAV